MPLWKLDNGLHLGKVIKPHSYLGMVKVAFFISGLEDVLEEDGFLFIEWNEKPVPYRMEEIRWLDDKAALLKLKGVDNEQEARKLQDRNVILPEEKVGEELLQEPEDDEFKGFAVQDTEGNHLGTVTALVESGPQSLLQVQGKRREFLIPIHEDLIREVNPGKKLIIVDLPEGLMEL